MSEVNEVKIEAAGDGWVSYDGYTVVSKKFSGAKVGQTWRITVAYDNQSPTGKVVNAMLIKEASQPTLRLTLGGQASQADETEPPAQVS